MPRDLPTLERELGFTEQEIWQSGRALALAIRLREEKGIEPDAQLMVRHDSLLRHRDRILWMRGPRCR